MKKQVLFLTLSFIFSLKSYSLGKKPPKTDLNVCPGTPSSLRFSWFSKIFHPCRSYNKEFLFNNHCKKDPLKISSRSKFFISSNGVTLHFFDLSISSVPPNWGEKLSLGFEIVDKDSNQLFKTKETSEAVIKISDGHYNRNGEFLNEIRIYGPAREGGQDEGGNLIENQFQGINPKGQFRFNFLVYSDGRNDMLKIPGPLLKDLPKKLKQRNTCN